MSGRKIVFTKMHGAGNDYIYVNTLLYNIENPQEVSLKWSDRHKGIGGDGLVLICKPTVPDADYRMRIFNADGSEAMMCGNASRCIGKYLFERGLTDATTVRLETLSGIKVLQLHVDEAWRKVESVTVDMLEPQLVNDKQYNSELGGSLVALDRIFKGTFVCMGNPHFVTFVDDVEAIDIALYGKILEYAPCFPERCNIEFAQILPDGAIRTRVWERGSGITMACGTGACATAVAAAYTGRAGNESLIKMDGGDLQIEWRKENGHVYMAGPATIVYDGEIEI